MRSINNPYYVGAPVTTAWHTLVLQIEIGLPHMEGSCECIE